MTPDKFRRVLREEAQRALKQNYRSKDQPYGPIAFLLRWWEAEA